MDHKTLAERLDRHPIIKARMEVLLNIAESAAGEFDRADDAELAVVEEIRKMGKELLQEWAVSKNNQSVEFMAASNANVKRHAKKNFTGKQL